MWSLTWAQQSLLKLQKGWVATDGAVNNNSPSHASAHSCTNATPKTIPLCGNTRQTHTHTVMAGGAVKADGKRVNGCVMLWRSAPGGVKNSISLSTFNSQQHLGEDGVSKIQGSTAEHKLQLNYWRKSVSLLYANKWLEVREREREAELARWCKTQQTLTEEHLMTWLQHGVKGTKCGHHIKVSVY